MSARRSSGRYSIHERPRRGVLGSTDSPGPIGRTRPEDQCNPRIVYFARGMHPTALAILLVVLGPTFVVLYPLLGCGPEGCPGVSQASHAALAQDAAPGRPRQRSFRASAKATTR